MGNSAAGRLTDAVAGIDIFGDAGGSQSRTLVTANLPPYTPSGTISGGSVTMFYTRSGNFQSGVNATAVTILDGSSGGTNSATAQFNPPTFSGNVNGGSSTPVLTVQPTIIMTTYIKL